MIATLALAASIALVGPAPAFGDSVTFTVVYPQDAARQARQPQYPDQPAIQVDCYQGGVRVASLHTSIDPKTKTKLGPGWWQGTTYPVTLGPFESNGLVWTSGGAECGAVVYSFDVHNQPHIWATTQFTVVP